MSFVMLKKFRQKWFLLKGQIFIKQSFKIRTFEAHSRNKNAIIKGPFLENGLYFIVDYGGASEEATTQ